MTTRVVTIDGVNKAIFEARLRPGGGWERLGAVTDLDLPGSISSEEPGSRQVFIFGWYNGDGPGVWRSLGGLDVADAVLRVIQTPALAKVASLTDGPYEMTWRRRGRSVPVRFRFVRSS